ncbi:putative outer membrane protein [Chlamydia psittaci 08-2626_L3]|nr:outer membrane protein [Chlamydia psittaci WS/RT/E30]EPP29395.1 putative outer membrane protein [Chlamydia psittaci 08-2626_L3]EPP32120.1 putative outer membrane protein [Chlamydia psittaci C1/97]
MKNSIYGVLILSSFTVSIAFANAENLDSSASFDGSTGAGQFTAKQSSQAGGTTYTLTADVTIEHVKSTTPANTSCFKNSTGNVTFVGANHSLIFEDIASTAQGAAISTNTDGKTITMSGFNVLSFISAPQAITGNAAIYGIASITIKENKQLVFDTNHSTAAGGELFIRINLYLKLGEILYLKITMPRKKVGRFPLLILGRSVYLRITVALSLKGIPTQTEGIESTMRFMSGQMGNL